MINVASGKGIYLGLGSLMTSMKDAPGIAVVRLEDPRAALQVCVVWRAAEASPTVLEFISAAREAFATDAASGPKRTPVHRASKTRSRRAHA